jgi:hypothetical protein
MAYRQALATSVACSARERQPRGDHRCAAQQWRGTRSLILMVWMPTFRRNCVVGEGMWFASRPGSDIWMCFSDLPAEVHEALWKRNLTKVSQSLSD